MSHSLKTSLVILALALSGTLGACAPTATSESTGAFVDDAAITTKVKADILADTGLKVFEIHVVTVKNVVQLTGVVDSRATISRASDVAGRVPGVRSVRNDLTVK